METFVHSLHSQQLLRYPEICTYFTWCSVQLLRHTLLFDRIHWVEHFTQVSIYHILQWQKQPRLWNNCQSQQVLKVQTPSSPTFLNFLASQQRGFTSGFQLRAQLSNFKMLMMLGPDTVIKWESRITYLDRIVVGPEGQMISSTQGWMLRPHIHLQMLEEIMVLKHYSKDLSNILK